MTEKQGGPTCAPTPLGRCATVRRGGSRHKWFCSAPMSDAFLVLAQAPLASPVSSCALDAGRRAQTGLLQRSRTSWAIAPTRRARWSWTAWASRGRRRPRRPTILEMVNQTRLDCVIGAAGSLRQAQWQAAHHCAHRSAFGKRSSSSVMRNVLADLCVKPRPALLLTVRLGAPTTAGESASPHRHGGEQVWVCKRARRVASAGVLGGNGYVGERTRALSRGAAQLHLGRLGKRHLPRRTRALAKEPAAAKRSRRACAKRVALIALDGIGLREALLARAEEGQARRLWNAWRGAPGSLLVATPPRSLTLCASRLSGDWGAPWAAPARRRPSRARRSGSQPLDGSQRDAFHCGHV